jgi:HK97 family phage portal protein
VFALIRKELARRHELYQQEVRNYSSTVPSSYGRGGWFNIVREPFAGAWQKNVEWTHESVLSFHAVYACITLAASDVGKLRPKLVQRDADGIWSETESPAFSPVLRRPNRYQNHIQFKEWWITSKLISGNTYVLKERDSRGVVVALYVLDPNRVQVLVSPDGTVLYQLSTDNLSGLEGDVTVPASEIIHDRINCLFHPLVGVSPIFAAGVAANVGLKIQNNSAHFFGKGSNPSGILTAPEEVDEDDAKRIQERWNEGYSGDNSGRVAVLGGGLAFTALRMSAVDAQTIQQLKWSGETVCSAFHMPPFKVGIGAMPTYQNGEVLNQIYYSDCLQSLIESMELCLDEGLGLTEAKEGKLYGVELDLHGLLRMDTAAQIKALAEGISGSVLTPNEARREVDRKPLDGGDTIYMQQQNYSLAALNKRDQKPDPFATTTTAPKAEPVPAAEPAAEPATKSDPDYWRRSVSLLRAA